MKEMIRNYVAFNTWANERISGEIITLTDEQLLQEMKSSFKNISETMQHIWNAQNIWLERLKGNSPAQWPAVAFDGTKEALTAGLMASSHALEERAADYGKKQLREEISYKTLNGTEGRSSVYKILMHVVNHGTYHRGQLVTMLRQAGKTEIPSTDLIAFFWQQDKPTAHKK